MVRKTIHGISVKDVELQDVEELLQYPGAKNLIEYQYVEKFLQAPDAKNLLHELRYSWNRPDPWSPVLTEILLYLDLDPELSEFTFPMLFGDP